MPDGTRSPNGALIHDDHILADALSAKLDKLEWFISSPTLFISYHDPLDDMQGKY